MSKELVFVREAVREAGFSPEAASEWNRYFAAKPFTVDDITYPARLDSHRNTMIGIKSDHVGDGAWRFPRESFDICELCWIRFGLLDHPSNIDHTNDKRYRLKDGVDPAFGDETLVTWINDTYFDEYAYMRWEEIEW